MDLGSIMLILALAVGVGIFISLPLTRHKPNEKLVVDQKKADSLDHERSMLLAERDRILSAVQELDFDNALGKIPAEDFPTQRLAMMARGADVLRRLDEIQPEPRHNGKRSAEDRLEDAVAARRADQRRTSANGADDLEMAIASRRRERDEKSSGFCPKCGSPVLNSDVFCSRCGTTLKS